MYLCTLINSSTGADAGTYLAAVTVHQKVGNDIFVVTPLGSKNVCKLSPSNQVTGKHASSALRLLPRALMGHYAWTNCIWSDTYAIRPVFVRCPNVIISSANI